MKQTAKVIMLGLVTVIGSAITEPRAVFAQAPDRVTINEYASVPWLAQYPLTVWGDGRGLGVMFVTGQPGPQGQPGYQESTLRLWNMGSEAVDDSTLDVLIGPLGQQRMGFRLANNGSAYLNNDCRGCGAPGEFVLPPGGSVRAARPGWERAYSTNPDETGDQALQGQNGAVTLLQSNPERETVIIGDYRTQVEWGGGLVTPPVHVQQRMYRDQRWIRVDVAGQVWYLPIVR